MITRGELKSSEELTKPGGLKINASRNKSGTNSKKPTMTAAFTSANWKPSVRIRLTQTAKNERVPKLMPGTGVPNRMPIRSTAQRKMRITTI